MTIKTLLPEGQDGIEALDQWNGKREEIKIRFLDNIGRPEFPRRQGDIETIESVQMKAIRGVNCAIGWGREKRCGHTFWFRMG